MSLIQPQKQQQQQQQQQISDDLGDDNIPTAALMCLDINSNTNNYDKFKRFNNYLNNTESTDSNDDDEDDCDDNNNKNDEENDDNNNQNGDGNNNNNKLNKEFICYICNNKLNEPKLLSCLHVFCKNCLNEQITNNLAQLSTTTTVSSLSPADSSSNGSTNGGYLNDDHHYHHHHHHHQQHYAHSQHQQNSHVTSSSSSTTSSFNHHTSIVCPLCKQETKIPPNGVDGLDDDYVMINMLDVIAIEEKNIACTSCTTTEKAVARCSDCSNFLCPNCVTAHQFMRCFENHRVVKFEDFKHNLGNNNGLPIHKPLFCKIHERELLKYYCTTCDIPICTECIVYLHKQPLHHYERLIDVEEQNIAMLDLMVNEAKSKINYCQDQFNTVENYLADLQDQLETARGSIDETYQSYKAILEKKRDKMVKELEDRHAKKELLIMEMHNTIDKVMNKISEVVNFSERVRKNGNHLEILLLKNKITSQISNILKALPEPKIQVNLQFMSTNKYFEEAIDKFFGQFDDTDDNNIQSYQQDIYATGLHDYIDNNDDNHQQSPSSADQDWMLNMGNTNQKALMNGINGHFDGQSPTSPLGQPWLANNLTGIQKLHSRHLDDVVGFNDDHPLHSPELITTMATTTTTTVTSGSGLTSSTTDWLMNVNMPNLTKPGAINSILLNNLTGVQNHFTQPPTPPTDLINGHVSNGFSNVNSRSQTPALTTPTPTTNSFLPNNDDFMSFGSSSMTQNLNQLTQLIAPSVTSAPLSIQSTSPPIIDPNQTFAGNGNLNPPVRNTKMSHMQIRTKFGQLGPTKGLFNSPHGFCLGVDEEIIVADTNNHRIQIFDKNGEFKYYFGSPGREEGQLWYPRKVAVMRQTGKFVVCDRGNERSRMQIFNKTGHFIKKIAIRYIDIVAGLAITNGGDIVAVDSVSPTVFCISEAGDLVKWFDCSDYMREPSDIAISGNEYYVCDFKGHCVVVFDENGIYKRRIGGENITNFPNGIDVSDAGDVLVGDSHGNRFHVAVFSREGEILSEFECPYVKVSRCCGLKITSEGYIVTLAKNNHHVLVLNTLYVS